MIEKRKSVRLNMPIKVDYRSLRQDFSMSSTCLSQDISTGGMRVRIQKKPDESFPVGLKISLPDERQPVLAEGEIAWLKEITGEDEGPIGDYEAGLRFAEISGFDRSRIARLLTMEAERQRFSGTSPSCIVTKIDLKDKDELFSLVKKSVESIEHGLRIIDEKIDPEEGGFLDLLGMDLTGQLVVIELTVEENETMLMEALKHYDWVLRNTSLLKRIYRDDIDFAQSPRVVLIGPLFSLSFRRQMSYIKPIDIKVLGYRCLNVGGQKALFFEKEEAEKEIFVERKLPEGLSIEEAGYPAQPHSEDILDSDEQHRRIARWLWKKN
ncbi:MAG: PilZ domain-containing protein [Candidatus Omnitrophica bacterium]|nr:PilZ domain-containing protein [Candidatus Omnitrophota bacterium]